MLFNRFARLVFAFLAAVLTSALASSAAEPESQELVGLNAPHLANRLETARKMIDEQKWDVALGVYESIYENEPLTPQALCELREMFELLRPKAPKNTDKAKANVWRVRAFIVKELDMTWDDDGAVRRCKAVYSQEEIERIQRCMKGFEEFVWEYSDGWLRIEQTCEVVDKTLTELDPIDKLYWAGPVSVMKILPEIEPNSTDTIMTFVKTCQENAAENADRVPTFCFGGAIGVWEPVTKGATYITFHWEKDSVLNEPEGEAQLHEWLHSLQWALDERRGWKKGRTGDPDGGRFAGEERDLEHADPCYRRDPDREKSWIGLYRHILQTHTTRNMLRDASPKNRDRHDARDRS